MDYKLEMLEAVALCDSDEEIFCGPITARELELRARRKLSRRTIAPQVTYDQSRLADCELTADLTTAAAIPSACRANNVSENYTTVGYMAPPSTPESIPGYSQNLETCCEDEGQEHSSAEAKGVQTFISIGIQGLPLPESSGNASFLSDISLQSLQSIPLMTGPSETSELIADSTATLITASPSTLLSVSNNLQQLQLSSISTSTPKKQVKIDCMHVDIATEKNAIAASQDDILDICINQQEVVELDKSHSITDADGPFAAVFPREKTTTHHGEMDAFAWRIKPADMTLEKVFGDKMPNEEDVLDICLSHQEDCDFDALSSSDCHSFEDAQSAEVSPSLPSFVTLRNKKFASFRKTPPEVESCASNNSGCSVLTTMVGDIVSCELKSCPETILEVSESLGFGSVCDAANSNASEIKIPTGFVIQKEKPYEDNYQQNLLMLTLQRRFHKQVAEIPTSLADLSLDETSGGLELNSNGEQSMNEFLINEAACRSMCAKETSVADDVSGVLELQVSTVSADEDGGFLTGFTELALYHAAKHAENEADMSKTSAGQLYPQDATRIFDISAPAQTTVPVPPNLDADNTLNLLDVITAYQSINTKQSHTFGCGDMSDKEVEETKRCIASCIPVNKEMEETESCNISFVSGKKKDETENYHLSFSNTEQEELNDTLDDMEMLETFGLQYMLSGKNEDFSKVGADIDGSFNVALLTKEQQGLLDSFAEDRVSAQKPIYCNTLNTKSNRPETARNLFKSCAQETTAFSLAFNACSVSTLTDLPAQSVVPTMQDSTQNACVQSSDQLESEFKFPKPVLTTKAKYQHETTPLKLSVPTKKTSKYFNNPSSMIQDMPHASCKTPVARSPQTPLIVKKPKYFAKIESPIGAYIHSSPASLISNKNPAQSDGKVVRTPYSDVITSRVVDHLSTENVDTNNLCSIIPVVGYKSSASLKLDEPTKSYLPHLDQKMKRLIDQPRIQVIKHKGRVKESDLPEGSPVVRQSPLRNTREKNGQVVDVGLLLDLSSQDVSVIVRKDAGRTNTLPR